MASQSVPLEAVTFLLRIGPFLGHSYEQDAGPMSRGLSSRKLILGPLQSPLRQIVLFDKDYENGGRYAVCL